MCLMSRQTGYIYLARRKPQHVQYMFDYVHVHSDHPLLLQKTLHDCSTMAWSVSLEQGAFSYRLEGWQHKGPEHCLSVGQTGQTAIDKV